MTPLPLKNSMQSRSRGDLSVMKPARTSSTVAGGGARELDLDPCGCLSKAMQLCLGVLGSLGVPPLPSVGPPGKRR
eukprot:13192294-Alexandrium_andersonii.AAC.1